MTELEPAFETKCYVQIFGRWIKSSDHRELRLRKFNLSEEREIRQDVYSVAEYKNSLIDGRHHNGVTVHHRVNIKLESHKTNQRGEFPASFYYISQGCGCSSCLPTRLPTRGSCARSYPPDRQVRTSIRMKDRG